MAPVNFDPFRTPPPPAGQGVGPTGRLQPAASGDAVSAQGDASGRLGGYAVRMLRDVRDIQVLLPNGDQALQALSAMRALLDAGRISLHAENRRLADRTVSRDGPEEVMALGRRLGVLRAASAQAGGVLFEDVLRERRLDSRLVSEAQRNAADALLSTLRLAAIPPAVAEPILRDALQAALRQAADGPASQHGAHLIAAAVAQGAVLRAADAVRGGDTAAAGACLGAAAIALGLTAIPDEDHRDALVAAARDGLATALTKGDPETPPQHHGPVARLSELLAMETVRSALGQALRTATMSDGSRGR